MLKKKCISFVLAVFMLMGTMVVTAGVVTAEAESGMQVVANATELAVKTEFSDTQAHVQRIANLFTGLQNPTRTTNEVVDFGQSYLIEKDSTDLWTITTRLSGDAQVTQDGATPFMINGSYIGANHGQSSGMRVTAPNHGLSYADIGSQWTTQDSVNWNLLRIIDENTLLFLSDGTYQTGAYTYGFKTLKAGSTLTRTGATGSLTVESLRVDQIFPSVRHTKKTAYAVSGGLKWKIEPNTAYDCDSVIIEESYAIIDPSTIADAVRANAPADGYTANPDLTVGADAMVNYNVTYTLLADGTILTEVNHEILKTIRIDSYGLLQYAKNADYAGGGIYRYLPNTKAFEATAAGSGTTQSFDFSVPTKIIGSNAQPYPNNYTYKSADSVDTTYPNERFLDFFSDGSNDVATLASGFLPIGLGAKENRANLSEVFYFYNSLKAYPRIYKSAYQDAAGTTLSAVGYSKLYAGGRSDNKNVYTIPYGDTLYTCVDMFASGASAALPSDYTVVNKSANVTVDNNVATAAFTPFDTHGYIVVSSDNTTTTAATAESVLAQLTAETISSEPLCFISRDLNFPSVMADSGITLTWESDKPHIIAADGTVTRPLLDAETVTLKATATDSSATLEKSFTLTVAPQTVTEISTNESFAAGVSGWGSSAITAALAGEAGQHYASFSSSTNFSSAAKALPSLTKLGSSNTYTVEYAVQLPADTPSTDIARIDIKANGKVISSIALTPGKLMVVVKGQTWYSNNGASNGAYSAGSWATFKTVIDPINNTRRIFYNGNELTSIDNSLWNSLADGTTTLGTLPTSMGLDIAFRGSAPVNFKLLLDDIRVYTEDTPEGYIQTLSDENKAAWVADLIQNSQITTEKPIAVTQNLTLNNGYKDYNLTDCGISVSWSSSDPAAISAEGVVSRLTAAKAVTMTATVTAGEATKTVSIPLRVVQSEATAIANATYAVNDFEGADRPTLSGSTYTQDTDSAHKTVLQLANTETNAAKYSSVNNIYSLNFDRRYFMSFDMKYKRTNLEAAPDAYGGVELLGVQSGSAGSVFLMFETRQVGLYTTQVLSDGSILKGKIVTYDMPASVKEGEWVTVTYDYNAVSRTYQIYLNGELVNDIPLLKSNADLTADVHALRGFQLTTSKAGTVSIDNLTIRQCGVDASIAHGGLSAALLTYASADQRATLTAKTLQPTGPATSKGTASIIKTDYANNPGLYNFDGGATLTYQLNNEAVTSVNPTALETKSLTITSAYKGITESKTVQRQLAPVNVENIVVENNVITKVLLGGTAPTGSKAVIAVYQNNGSQLQTLTVCDIAAVITPNITIDRANNTVKVFVLNSTVDLKPLTIAATK